VNDAPNPPAEASSAQRDALLLEVAAGYDRLVRFLDSLDDAAQDDPVDAAGWTIKDHVTHLAVWARSMIAVIDGRPRWEAMGVSRELWQTIEDGYDAINADIQQRHRHLSPAEARAALAEAHAALEGRVAALSVAELELPYNHYQPWATGRTAPLHAYVRGNTSEHYDEHRRYMAAIVGAGEAGNGAA